MLIYITWFITATLMLFSSDTVHPEKETIEIQFAFDAPCQGQILISCFQTEEDFMDVDHAVFAKILSCQSSVLIEGVDPRLPRAIMAFVDENNNNRLDRNLFGVPTEPYAISNDFSNKWREPKFQDAAESTNDKVITLVFNYWKNK